MSEEKQKTIVIPRHHPGRMISHGLMALAMAQANANAQQSLDLTGHPCRGDTIPEIPDLRGTVLPEKRKSRKERRLIKTRI